MITTLVPVQLQPPVGHPRSSGVHVSGVIRCIATETGVLDPKYVEELSLVDANGTHWWESLDDVARLRIGMGLAWEQWYIPQLGHVIDHPGELCVDGIYLTPDGESLDMVLSNGVWGYEQAIHEVKFTYKSINTVAPRLVKGHGYPDLESQWMWLTQAKAYAKAKKCRVVYFHVNFACGDYSRPIRPVLLCWRIDFTQEEIDESWDLLLDYVRERQHLLSESPSYFDAKE